VGMIVGLIQFALNHGAIEENRVNGGVSGQTGALEYPPLVRTDWERMGVIGILFLFSTVFWALFMQAGSSFSIFAKDFTDGRIAGFMVPASWFQSINPIFIISLAPVSAWLWSRLGNRFTSPSKFATGLLLLGVGILLLVPASRIVQGTPGQIVRVSPLWLTGLYFMHTLAELCFSPVGMSLTSRLAPPRFAGLMMGVWFASIGTGSLVSGLVTGLMDRVLLTWFFGIFGWIAVGAAALLWLLKPFIQKLMGEEA